MRSLETPIRIKTTHLEKSKTTKKGNEEMKKIRVKKTGIWFVSLLMPGSGYIHDLSLSVTGAGY